jgi:GT2 family glycosyltransferase
MPSTQAKSAPEPQSVSREVNTLPPALQLAEEQFRRRDFELRYLINKSLVDSITQSGSWRLLAPLRLLHGILKPRGCDARHLIAWQHLEVGEEGQWCSTGIDPQFVVPCYIPAGWVRIRLEISGEARGRSEIFVDTGHGFHSGECLERFSWSEILRDELFVRLRHPIRAIRLDPLDGPGRFQLERFTVEPLPPPQALYHALRKKLRLLRAYRCTFATLGRALQLLFQGRVGELWRRLFLGLPDSRRMDADGDQARAAYAVWQKQREMTDADRRRLRGEAQAMAHPPRISVIMPVYNTPEFYLRRAVESVLRQTYPHWELCLVDDGSTAKHVDRVVRRYASLDSRIKYLRRARNGGIASASNDALAAATGDFIALLDHDDELAEHALSSVARAIVQHPEADFLYSDEDKLEMDDRRTNPFFKPDWCPDFFLTCMYTCHLGAYRTELARRVGGFRSEFDNAQDYDLALRIVAHIQNEERAKAGHGSGEERRIRHVPDVLYHWRKIPGSTAIDHEAKPKAAGVAIRAVQSYLDAVHRPGMVEPGPSPGLQRVRYAIQGTPKISIVIPSAGRPAVIHGQRTTFIGHIVRSIRSQSSWTNYEILVVDNDDMPPELQRQLDDLGVIRIPFTAPFNLSAKINLGAAKADGEFLLLLNDDMEVITPDWLECMLEHAQWPEVGAVGAKLLFPDGRLQHAGVTLLDGKPHHHFYGWPGHDPGYFGSHILTRNYSAVTGACLMTKTELFQELGGFDEGLPLNFNDIDFCLRIRRRGFRIVFTPYAQLFHFESASKAGCFAHEVDAFVKRWGGEYPLDPFYSPHLAADSIDYRLPTVKRDAVPR